MCQGESSGVLVSLCTTQNCSWLADHRWPQLEWQEAIRGKCISFHEDGKCKGLEMRIQLECSFKEQEKDWAVWDVERVMEMILQRVAGAISY